MDKLTLEQEQKMAEDLLGSCSDGSWYAEEYDIEPHEVYEIAERHGVIVCECCGWWVDKDNTDESSFGEINCSECIDEQNII